MSELRESRRVTRRTFLRLSFLVSGSAAVSGLLAACQQAAPSPTAAPPKPAEQPKAAATTKPAAPAAPKAQFDEWVIGLSEDITAIDPATPTGGAIYWNVEYHFFENLVGYEGPTYQPTPRLAESWKYLDDSTLEIKLRRNVKFHNGDDFTADDVLYTYQIHKSTPALASGPILEPVEKLEAVDSVSTAERPWPNWSIVPRAREKLGPEVSTAERPWPN